MKNKWLVGLLFSMLTLQGSLKVALAGTVEYPFDSIRVTAATYFEVNVPVALEEGSVLSGTSEEILRVYFAQLALVKNGDTSATSMLVVAKPDGTDLTRYIINSYGHTEESDSYAFAWHILIDPTIGIYKDMTLLQDMKQFYLVHTFAEDTWEFSDNLRTVFPTVAESVRTESDLDLEIAAYAAPEESSSEGEISNAAKLYYLMTFVSNLGLAGCTPQTSSVSSEVSSSAEGTSATGSETLQALTHDQLTTQLSAEIKSVFEA